VPLTSYLTRRHAVGGAAALLCGVAAAKTSPVDLGVAGIRGALCNYRSLPPAGHLNVRAFGAIGDGQADDTAVIQRALNALAPGQWLIFPPGQYRHASRLVVARSGVTLSGYGATLHASNSADQALLIQASGVRVQGFTMTAITDRRRHAPWESRIAIWRDGDAWPPLTDVQVYDNQIIESGAPGSSGANSSSSAAIFVHRVHGFVVAGNEIRRSLSDGIHITGGARHGRVWGNTVRESGDDMIAIVSYLIQGDARADPVHQYAAQYAQRLERERVQDVLIAHNDVAGQYWGRGISVVGGQDVTIAHNRIDATTHAAGVYIAREQGWGSFGVRNVRVQGNLITRVQNTEPAYTVLPATQRGKRTGHGAIELVAHVYADEARWPVLRESLTVERIALLGNSIQGSTTAGVRIGYGWDRWAVPAWRSSSVREALRRYTGAHVGQVVLQDNQMHQVAQGVQRLNAEDTTSAIWCSGNRMEGRSLEMAQCVDDALNASRAADAVSGSAQRMPASPTDLQRCSTK
jgi:hypothetical protein